MKLAVLADIHSNLAALEEVTAHIDRWQPDLVLVAGDTINRGPRPAECWQWVQHRCAQSHAPWTVLKGNHEEYVVAHGQPRPVLTDIETQIFRTSEWTFEQLGASAVAELDCLPLALELNTEGYWQALGASNAIARCTHGSMRSTRDGIFIKTSDEVLYEQIGPPCPALFCVGHTHQPLIRQLNQTLVVNVGAVGLPFVGDWRAAYAQLIWQHEQWNTQIIRLEYDRARSERDYVETGFLVNGGPLARLMLRELQIAHGQLYSWSQAYEKRVMAGEMSMEQSVDAFLRI